MRALVLPVAIALPCCLFGTLAHAGSPGDLTANEDAADPAVYGGTEVELCGWPTTVNVLNGNSSCTGTLIHPRVVSYAAHCGANNTTIRFGEGGAGWKTVDVVNCQTNPSYTGANDVRDDYAFCVLEEAVDLPVTPPIHGCELGNVSNGTQAALVGFGNNSGNTGSGTKRWGMTTLSQLTWSGNTVNVGQYQGDATICSGDSGGPLFVQYAGAWHTLGIASVKYDDTCNSAQGQYTLLNGALPWIEQQSGIDVTPCQDLNGNWDPTPGCGGFLTSGATGSGNYNTWCEGTGASGWSTTCGPGWDTYAETNPPNVAITYPGDGESFAQAPAVVDISISATDDSGYMSHVQIEIDGMLIPNVDDEEAYVFEGVSFPNGSYTIRALGVDTWGNEGWSAPVTINVGDGGGGDTTGDPSSTTGADESGDSGTEDSGEGEAGTGGDDGDPTDTGLPTTTGADTGGFYGGDEGGQESGCACGVDPKGSGQGAWLLLSLLALVRRRRAV